MFHLVIQRFKYLTIRLINMNKTKKLKIEKPCHILPYCPYGPLVEQFPLKKKRTNKSCKIFGHECPIFYVAEGFRE